MASDAPDSSPDALPENPSDLLAAALDGEGIDGDLDSVDRSLDSLILDEALGTSGADKPLVSLEEARRKLPDEVIDALQAKFKGSLIQVRQRDARDQLF